MDIHFNRKSLSSPKSSSVNPGQTVPCEIQAVEVWEFDEGIIPQRADPIARELEHLHIFQPQVLHKPADMVTLQVDDTCARWICLIECNIVGCEGDIWLMIRWYMHTISTHLIINLLKTSQFDCLLTQLQLSEMMVIVVSAFFCDILFYEGRCNFLFSWQTLTIKPVFIHTVCNLH